VFVTQISPTLGMAPDQLAELQGGAAELEAAASPTAADRGRIRGAFAGVMKLLGLAAASAGGDVAIAMGDDLAKEILRQLPH
jgi:hypothetical protein